MNNQGYAGKYLVKDKYFTKIRGLSSKFSSIYSKAVIERKVLFPDVSFYQEKINWDVMATKTPAVIIRAGQRTWIDTQFARNYSEAKRVGIKRGIYWFYDSREHPDAQADILISLIGDDLPEMEIFCDWETDFGGSYFDLSNAVRFMKRVESRLHNVKVGMYTGYYFFKDHSSATKHFVEYEYLRNKPLWLAWYVADPTYVLIPQPWNKITHWQFTSSGPGKEWGTQSNGLDMNYFNGTVQEFNQQYGAVVETPPIMDYEITQYDNGTFLVDMPRFDTNCYALVCDPTKVKFVVTDHFNTVDGAVSEYKAFAGVNGDGWYTHLPNSIAWSQGMPVNPIQKESEPFFNVTERGIPEIDWKPSGVSFHNAVSGDRYLVQNGEINQALYSRVQEKNARTAVGITESGKVVLFKCDGWDIHKEGLASKGLNWIELANCGLELNCVDFINLDGGGSSTMWVDGEQVGIANDDGVIGLRSTINHLLVMVNGEDEMDILRTKSVTPFYRFVNGVVKGQDGTLSDGYELEYTTETVMQNGKQYTIIREPLPGAVKPENAIESKFLEVVRDSVPPVDPPADEIAYLKSYDENDNELDTWVRQ